MSLCRVALIGVISCGFSSAACDVSGDIDDEIESDSFDLATDIATGLDHVRPSPGRSRISDLPVPPTRGVRRPSGPPRNLRVLDWAGFRGAVSYTYDDSQPSQVQHYEALQATGVRMTFYINSETASASVDTWRQAVRDGHEIGNHTVHHCRAPSATIPTVNGCIFGTVPADATAESEMDENSEWIRSNLGQRGVWSMASPFGDANWDPFASTRFLVHRDVFQGMIAPNDDTDPFHLPCYMAGAPQDGGIPDSLDQFNALIDTARDEGKWMIFLFHTIFPSPDNWYGPVEISSITGSTDHIEDLGDVWNDSMVYVGAYWRGQKLFNSITPTRRGRATTWRWQLPENFPRGKYLRVTVDGGRLWQRGERLRWSHHGYYEVSLDARSLTLTP